MYTDLTPAGKAAVKAVLVEHGIKARLSRDYTPPGYRADCIKFKSCNSQDVETWSFIKKIRELGFDPDVMSDIGYGSTCDTAWIGAKVLKARIAKVPPPIACDDVSIETTQREK